MELKRIAVFASGRGSNFKQIVRKTQDGSIRAKLALLITNNPTAGAIKIARDNDIPVRVFPPADFPDRNSYNDSILSVLLGEQIVYIALAGYMLLMGNQIVDRFQNRIINVHPALLPAFGGKGMYGRHVHEAVFNSGVKFSGVTVHFVDKRYDGGPIILQDIVRISDARNAEDIAQRVLKIEHRIFPEAVRLLVSGRLQIVGQRVNVLKETESAEN